MMAKAANEMPVIKLVIPQKAEKHVLPLGIEDEVSIEIVSGICLSCLLLRGVRGRRKSWGVV